MKIIKPQTLMTTTQPNNTERSETRQCISRLQSFLDRLIQHSESGLIHPELFEADADTLREAITRLRHYDRQSVASSPAAQEVETASQAVVGVGADWRKYAAAWLEGKAMEQEQNNAQWPRHAEAYQTWRDRPAYLRRLSYELTKEALAR